MVTNDQSTYVGFLMKFQILFRLSALMAALGYCFPALAQKASTEPQVIEMITVTAGRGTDLADMPASTSVLDRQEVQNMPQATTDQIVNKIPGIYINPNLSTALHPTGSTFNIRGFGTSTNVNTLVMVDGIPLNDPFFRTINWAQIPKNSINSIEVIRGGGATSLWGNLAMGGVVNLVTRAPQDDTLSVYADYGSYNTVNTGISGQLFKTDKMSMGLSFDYSRSDGYNSTPSDYRNPNMTATGAQVYNGLLSTYFTPDADSTYYLKFKFNQTQESTATWSVAGNNWNTYMLSAGGSTRFADNSSVNFNSWASWSQMQTTNAGQTPAFNILTPSISTPYVSQNELDSYQSFGGSVFYQKDFGQFKDVKFGLDARMITSNDNIAQFGSTGAISANLINNGQNTFQGLFVSGTYKFEQIPLDVTFGLREDFYQISNASLSGNVYSSTGGASPISSNLSNNSYASFDPSLGLKLYATDNLDLRAGIYRNFAAPGMNQLYRTYLSGSSITIANPALTPQTNFGQEIGFDLHTKDQDGKLSFTVFNNNLSNFLDLATNCSSVATCNSVIAGTGLTPGSISTVKQYVNAGSATLRGYEIIGEAEVLRNLKISLGFTQTWAFLSNSDYGSGTAPSDPTNAQLGQVPPWMVQAGAQWQATQDLMLNAHLQSFPSYWQNTAHTQLNDGATLVDIGFRYQWDKTVQIYGGVQNVFNVQYLSQGLGVTTFEGNTLNTGTVPTLGMPRWFTVGMRATF